MKTSSRFTTCQRETFRSPSLARLPLRLILPSLAAVALLLGASTASAGWVAETFTNAGSGTWVAPAGVTAITVEVWGGGGGGGGDTGANNNGAGGGGGGAYARLNSFAVTPGQSYSYTVGVGGASSGTSQVNGGNGGASFFVNAATLNAVGGNGGTAGSGTAGGNGGAAGATGDVKFSGGNGAQGAAAGGGGGGSGGTASNGNPGANGTPPNGAEAVVGGGPGGSGGNNGNGSAPASGPGGGGGGADDASSGSVSSGAGAPGQIRITYYAPATATFATAGTRNWTAPPGVTEVTVEAWGGGGRGGSDTLSGSAIVGGGGGGGAYSSGTIPVVPGTEYTFVVGAGASTTSAGGDSYFTAMSVGNVGAKGGNSVADNSATGATGGAAAAGFGTITYSGGTGASGSSGNYGGGGGSSAGTGSPGVNGSTSNGGIAPTGGGNGGNGATSTSNPGIAGTAPGGGGGGARASATGTAAGGNGAPGQIRISYTPLDNTLAGAATAVAAGQTSIAVVLPYYEDANANNTYAVEYKFSSGSTWVAWVEEAAHTISPYTTTITGLTPGASYDVRVTYNDPDGVTGDSVQTLTGVTTTGGDIVVLNNWSNLYHGTATTAQNINYPVPTGSDAQRVLVVAIASGRTAAGTRTVTLTYGGQPLTLVNGDMSSATPQQHTALYYLNEAGLDAAANSTLSVTVSGGTTRMTDVFAAVLDNVDQSNPITDSKNYNSGTTAVSTFQFASALTVNARALALEVITSHRTGSSTLRTITYAGNWTKSIGQSSTATDAITNSIAMRAVPTSGTTDTSSMSFSGTALASMTAMSLTAAKYSPNVIWPTASAITLGQSLSASTLNDDGEASVPGTFAFTDDSEVPGSVGSYSASVTFTPTDTATYNPVVGSVDVTVIPDEASVSEWPTATAITYGQALSASSLIGGTASVPGTFAFTDDTIVPDGVGIYSASVTFTPNDTETYDPIVGSVDVLVNQAIPNVTTWPTASAITYGQALSASTLSGGAASVNGTFAFAAPATVPPAGPYGASVVFTPEDITNYETVANTVNVTVNKATPEVTSWPSASGITYGDALAASSLTGGEASVSGTFAFTDDALVPNASNYPASVTFTPSDAANYNLVTDDVTVAVAPRTLTPSVVLNNREYDGTTTATTIASRDLLGGMVGDDDVSLGSSGTVAPFSSAAVDSYTIEVSELSLTGDDADNYALSTPSVSVNAAITPKELTIVGLTGENKPYDGTTAATVSGTAELSGVVGEEDVTLAGTPVYTFASANVGTGIAITTTGYELAGADKDNYTLTQPVLSANILAKELTITGLTGENKPYDGTTAATVSGTAALNGVVGVEDVTLAGTPVYTFASANVGTGIEITTTGYELAGEAKDNYTLTQPVLSADILAKELTITGLTGENKPYDGTTAATVSGTAVLNGVVGVEDVTLAGTPVYTFASANVGAGIEITTTGYELAGDDKDNYTLTQPVLSANILAKELTITGLTGENKPYDGTTAATVSGTAALSGVVGVEDVTLAGTPVYTFASANVGTGIEISTTGYELAGADKDNYTLTQPTLSANILAKELTITGLTGENKPYDGTPAATVSGTAELSGVVGEEDVTLAGTPVYTFASANVGTGVAITTTGYELAGEAKDNYTLTQPVMSADITALELTIVGLTGENKPYDGTTTATVSGTAELSGVVGEEDVTLAGTPVYTFASANVGTGIAITTTGYELAGEAKDNYTLTQPGLSANITPLVLTVEGTFTANSKPYDGDASATIAENNLTLVTKVGDDDVVLSAVVAFLDKTAASGKTVSLTEASGLTGADAENYTLSLVGAPTATADITVKPLTLVGLTAANKPYDGNTDAQITSYGTLNGVIEPDVVTLDTSEATASFDTAAVGNGKTVTVTGLALAGDDAGNYSIGDQTTTANITGEVLAVAPILVLTNVANPFTEYYREILLTEGLNSIELRGITEINASTLAAYEVVILGEMTLSEDQVTMLTDWVTAGGNLIAMRPDKQLAGLLGLTDAEATLAEGYLQVDTTKRPGLGIVGQTIQYHSAADLYTLAGATTVATLYSDAATATASPAVTLRSVGSNGGHAAAFTYDLARSVVYTRQGNPAWAGQERDGFEPLRPSDLFFGNAPGDPQPDWINLNRVDIPQADEQQRLLANMIIQMNKDRVLVPRFWYFPNDHKAVIVMTGDDHAWGGTAGRFDQYLAYSDPGGSVEDWETIRSTSYVYPGTVNATPPLTDAQAADYHAQGFEIGLHTHTFCANYTSAMLHSYFTDQLTEWTNAYPSLPPPTTHRIHCIAWSDYTTAAEVGREYGIRLDVSYYYWPGTWAADWPGLFTGSGMPMRFATANGQVLDVFQAATQMTDESSQVYSYTVDSLLNRALGPEGYYGFFVANMHTDFNASPYVDWSDAIIQSATSRGVPVISARQLLTWTDARYASLITNLQRSGDTQTFSLVADPEARGLRVMVPVPDGFSIGDVNFGGSPVAYSQRVVKGVEYAVIPAATGDYEINLVPDLTPPVVVSVSPANGDTDVSIGVTMKVQFSEAMDGETINTSTLELRDGANELVPISVTYDPSTFTASLGDGPLELAANYTVTVKGAPNGVTDLAGNALASDYSWSFTTVEQVPSTLWTDLTLPAIESASDDNAVELGLKFRTAVSGYVTAIRFYKGAENTGTHVGRLWTVNGTPLASVSFVNETASGWQHQSLTNPVPVSANTTYIVSYHAPNGRYSVNGIYFSGSDYENYPLRALADGEDGGNGVAAYGPSGTFPNQSFNSANYWVDLVFVENLPPDETPPQVTSVTPANGATGVSPSTTVTVTFDEAMDADTMDGTTFTLKDALDNPVAASVTYNAALFRATLTPEVPLALNTTYTATVKGGAGGVADTSGNELASDYVWSFTTAAEIAASIWDDTAEPGIITIGENNPVAVGLKFHTTAAGQLMGIRFYKGPANTGPHVGKLWTAGGTELASVTFVDETATGWQQQMLTTPVAIESNTVYVVSYHSPSGEYSVTSDYFAAGGHTNGPLVALGDADVAGGNAVAGYGDVNTFPTQNFGAPNYWVDVVFVESVGVDAEPPQVVGRSPAPAAENVSVGAVVTVTFDEAMDADTITGSTILLLAGEAEVPGSVTYNAGTKTATLDPDGLLTANTVYTVKAVGGELGVKDLAGNALAADDVWSFTTELPDTTAPTVVAVSPADGAINVSPGAVVTVTFDEAMNADTINATTITLSPAVAAMVSYNPATWTATLTPNGPLALSTLYTVTVGIGVEDVAGNALAAPVDSAFTTTDQVSLWSLATEPVEPGIGGEGAIELGVKFRSAVGGYVTAIRFYKAAGSPGPHVGKLYSLGGELLASAVFTDETASGWQQVGLGLPVAVAPDTTYVASYYAPEGGYLANFGYFLTSGWANPPLSAPSTAEAGGNGVYNEGEGFPQSTVGGANYWVDVVFVESVGVDAEPPQVVGRSPAPAAENVSVGAVVTVTFDEAMDADTITGSTILLLAGEAEVPGSVTYNAGTKTATLDPDGLLTANTVYTVKAVGGELGVKDLAGNALAADDVWSFTTELPDTTAPTVVAVSPADGAINVSPGAVVTVTFDEAMNADTINATTITLSPAVAAVVSYNPATWTATLTPNGPLALSTLYTVTVGIGVEDVAGNALAAPVDSAFTTTDQVSLWSLATEPVEPGIGGEGAIELGVKFRSAVGGYVTAIRFYKAAGSPGPHVGKLYSLGGELLASAVFTDETASGWQQVGLGLPVAVAPDTTYVASYYAPEGGYLANFGYFLTSGWANPPLSAPSTAEAGGNGVYNEGEGFPQSTVGGANYWVDVVFVESVGVDAEPPQVVGRSPAPAAENVSVGAVVTVTFDEAMDADTITGSTILLLAGEAEVPGSVTYNAGTKTATLDPDGLLTANTVYTVKAVGGELGVKDLAGNALAADDVWSFTTALPDTTAPTVVAVSPADGAINVSPGAVVTVTFDEAMNAGTIDGTTFTLKDALDNPMAASVTYHAGLFRATLTPEVPLALNTTYTATVKGGAGGVADTSGNELASDYVWSFTTAAEIAASIWDDTAEPGIITIGENNPVAVGLKFHTTAAGQLMGIRFYKGPANTGPHVGKLWTAGGTELASVTFVDETATGWQQQMLTTPVAIESNTVYVVSYHSPSGEYSVTSDYFAAGGHTNGPLVALGDADVAGGNAVAGYGDVNTFPTQNFGAPNYWVDVVFELDTTALPDTTSPALVSITESTETPGEFTLEWRVVVGRTYALQWKANLLDTEWTQLETRPADSAIETFTYDVEAEGEALSGFFRLLDVTP